LLAIRNDIESFLKLLHDIGGHTSGEKSLLDAHVPPIVATHRHAPMQGRETMPVLRKKTSVHPQGLGFGLELGEPLISFKLRKKERKT